MSALQSQVGGQHYLKLAIQPAEYSTRNGLGHMAGDAIAYITRYKDKNGKEDLLKAIQSIQILIELEYPEPKEEQTKLPSSVLFWKDDHGGLYRGEWDGWADSFHLDYGVTKWTRQVLPIYYRDRDVFHVISEAEARKLVEQAGGVW